MQKLAYFLDIFPHYSETFIKNELVAMSQYDVELRLYSVIRPVTQTTFTGIDHLLQKTNYLPDDHDRSEKLRSLITLFRQSPGRVWRSWRQVRAWHDPHALYHWGYCLPLALRMQKEGIEHIHAHFANKAAELAVLVSMITGIPCSFTGHGRDVFCNRRLLQQKMDQARFIIIVADYMREFLQQAYPSIPKEKYHKIIMGVNPDQFQPRTGEPEGTVFNILSVARLEEKKGLPYLIEALANLRSQGIQAKVTIIGEGKLRSELQAIIHRLKLSDHCLLVGALPPDQVRQALLKTSVFCLPCIVADDGDRDSMPVSIKEAMAMRVPVVATREVAIPEMVKDGAGILVPPHDARSLALALQKVHDMSPEERSRMGATGRKIIEQEFSIAEQTGRLAELFGIHPVSKRM